MNLLPPGPLLFDTNIYIRFSRGEGHLWVGRDVQIVQRTTLSAVVAAELYAGTRHAREKRALDALCQAHRALGLFSVPSAASWIDAGILLRRARSIFGQMEFVQQFRDALIALESVRARGTLVTENIDDFARWQSLLRSAGMSLRLFRPS